MMVDSELSSSKIEAVKLVHRGNWINTNLIKYKDPLGVEREWEACSYVRKPDKSMPDSVQIVAILQRRLHHNCIVLVQQFRPPLGCFSIEFPAGMVDEQDETVQAAALRELREETGYSGTIMEGEHLEVPVSLDPSCQSSTITTVHVIINGDESYNVNCKQRLDDGEFIKVLLVPVRDLLSRLNEFIKNKNERYVIDSRLYSFAAGLNMGASLNNFDKPIVGIF